MQYRIVAALRAAARGENPSEPHEQRTAALAAAALEQDTRRQWSLLGNPSRMRIQTLDSLNASIARARPISAPASAGGVRVVVDAELAALHRAAAVSTLDYLAEPGPYCDASTEGRIVTPSPRYCLTSTTIRRSMSTTSHACSGPVINGCRSRAADR